MVVILELDSNIDKYYVDILQEMNIEYKISLREIDISKADHLLLPDTKNLPRIIKKMQIMNLFSLLRLIKVPILGINNGMILMCNKINDINQSGLGFFNINANIINTESSSDESIPKGKIEELKKSILLTNIFNKELLIRNANYLEGNPFSVSNVNIEGKKISFIMEEDNHYGVQIDIEKNRELFNSIIKNFVSIKKSK